MARRPPSPVQLDALLAQGEHRAVEALVRPWARAPTAPIALQVCWAKALAGLGRHVDAAQAWQLVCRRHPTPAHLVGLGRSLAGAGHHRKAVPILLRALASAPSFPPATDALLQAIAAEPGWPPAAQALELLQAAQPDDARPHAILAKEHLRSGRLEAAQNSLKLALVRDPAHAESHLLLAALLNSVGDHDTAAAHAEKARIHLPDHPEPLRVSALIAGRRGELDQARTLLEQALSLRPDRVDLLWARARQFPRLPDSMSASEAALHAYTADLHRLARLADQTLPQQAAAWVAAVQDAFPVHYTGGDCMEVQRLHGSLVHRAMTAACPLPPPAPPRRERIRVGFVSSLFRRHTVTKLFARWMTTLDPARFEVFGYHLGQLEDATSASLAQACAAWRHLPGPIPEAIAAVQADAPDALLFPELGMDAQPLRLAALRLAPFQAMSWGHPITSGLPTIDAFLACKAMAVSPDRRWTHEKRVDLPGIGIDYPRPPRPPATERAHFDLPDRTLLLCVQSLQKYRPAADDLHARIAAGAPEALLVFVAAASDRLTTRLQDRMRRAFSARGLQLDAHVRFLPRLPEADWMRLLSLGDLFLDSPEWSGGNTVLEAISTDLPCLAWPGDTFRGRHCHGILGELGIPELQPGSAEEWVAAAIALARDPAARIRLRERIASRSDTLFDDPRATRALEALLTARCR